MINKLYKSRYFPISLQTISLTVFVFLIIGGIHVNTNDAEFAKQLRNTNLSNLIVWSYWWPLIVLTAVIFGRQWCTICPIELISALTQKFGLNKRVPAFFKSGWFITIFYAFIAIVAIHSWGIHRIPHLMAIYLISLIGLAILLSFIFKKRAFCSYLCPVGKLLGLYSLLSPFGLRIKSHNICNNCKTKDCIDKSNSYNLTGRSCQSSLYPAKITDNRDCILCTQCVKVCPHDNIEIRPLKKTFFHFDTQKLELPEVGMICILTGFISYEILSSWKESKMIIQWIPRFIHQNLIQTFSYSFLEGLLLFLVIPLAFLIFVTIIAHIIQKRSFIYYLKLISGSLLPIIAIGHLFKALLKTTSRIPYWHYAIEEPTGIEYASQLVNGDLHLHTFPVLNMTITILGATSIIISSFWVIINLFSNINLNRTNQFYISFIVALYAIFLTLGPISSMI